MNRPDLEQHQKDIAALVKYVRSRADRRLRGTFDKILVSYTDGKKPVFTVTGFRLVGGAHMGIGTTLEAAMDDMFSRIERMPDDAVIGEWQPS